MTPEEHERFKRMEKNVVEILRAMIGDDFTEIPGLIQDMKDMKNEVKGFKEQFRKARFIVYGLGIGFAAGGAIFGYAGGKALFQWLAKLFV